jgi:hypothetical protein
MAHFAKLDENNNVIGVHVVVNDVLIVNGIESEQAGIDFLTGLHGHSLWKQTSYNGSIRANYAGIGYIYDTDFDVFIAPRPYPSWKLNYTNYQWEAPVAKPEDIESYVWKWSEVNKEWIAVEING